MQKGSVAHSWAWGGSGAGSEPDFNHFFQIEAGLEISAESERSRIVMSRNCQLKYAMP